MEIYFASLIDIEEILQLQDQVTKDDNINECIYSPISMDDLTVLINGGGGICCCREEDKLCSFACFQYNPVLLNASVNDVIENQINLEKCLRIRNVVVKKRFRRNGLYIKMLNAIKEYTTSLNFSGYVILVSPKNTASLINLFRWGCKVIGYTIINNGFFRLLMLKKIEKNVYFCSKKSGSLKVKNNDYLKN